MITKFGLVIIGGGAAGFAAAIKADELKAKTLMVNSGLPMGGTCVNVGCVPTKFLLEVANKYYEINHPTFSSLSPVSLASCCEINFMQLIKEKDELVNSLRKCNYQDVLENLPNITYKEGKAKFISEKEIEVDGEKITSDKFIISTGSSPKVIPIEGLSRQSGIPPPNTRNTGSRHCREEAGKETGFLTNRTALEIKNLPESLLVIGAGPIGLEFSQIFSRLGTKVTIVELMEHILPQAEPIISQELRKSLEEEGIRVITSAKTKRVEKRQEKKIIQIQKDNNTQELETEEILLATGVVGNSQGLGLEKLGIELDKNSFIKVNEYLQTKRPHIYAAGDIIGAPWLETIAAKEGNIAAKNALTKERTKMDFLNIPYAVFTSPQVASVGMKESEYMEKYGTCLCRMVKMDRIPKAKAIKQTKGLIFMVIGHKDKRIKGVHILSELASEIIHEAALAIKQGLTIDEIIDMVHIFPTFSEAIKIVAQSFKYDPKRMSCCVE